MPEHSAGILVYKYTNQKLEVMLSHPGGPFWAKKDNAAWSIPKGLRENDKAQWFSIENARKKFSRGR